MVPQPMCPQPCRRTPAWLGRARCGMLARAPEPRPTKCLLDSATACFASSRSYDRRGSRSARNASKRASSVLK
jgi:hypothetical protein